MMHKHYQKQPRFHPDLEWESKTLTNEFIDINRMALDDRYGKNAAPLSKRRNGIGFTDGTTPGLFGFGGIIEDANSILTTVKARLPTAQAEKDILQTFMDEKSFERKKQIAKSSEF